MNIFYPIIPPSMPIGKSTPALAMPLIYQRKNPVESYRQYYKNDKKELLVYTNRTEPSWLL